MNRKVTAAAGLGRDQDMAALVELLTRQGHWSAEALGENRAPCSNRWEKMDGRKHFFHRTRFKQERPIQRTRTRLLIYSP
jgi:hypothetical protein